MSRYRDSIKPRKDGDVVKGKAVGRFRNSVVPREVAKEDGETEEEKSLRLLAEIAKAKEDEEAEANKTEVPDLVVTDDLPETKKVTRARKGKKKPQDSEVIVKD